VIADVTLTDRFDRRRKVESHRAAVGHRFESPVRVLGGLKCAVLVGVIRFLDFDFLETIFGVFFRSRH